eukprot:GDKH01012079.1.p1 GENE.GDKH01012079.1~~GDKH01012079.1.p1  ORF type:complete len:63 (-),score=0.47 GDKH01012079.1:16-204(-)
MFLVENDKQRRETWHLEQTFKCDFDRISREIEKKTNHTWQRVNEMFRRLSDFQTIALDSQLT